MEAQVYVEPLAVFTTLPPQRAATVAIKPQSIPSEERTDAESARTIDGELKLYSVRFFGGRYECRNGEVLDQLRKHSGNQANGGRIFAEIPRSALTHSRQLIGVTGASLPEGGLTDEDRNLLATLRKRGNAPSLPPAGILGTVDLYTRAVVRFRVAGVKSPRPNDLPSVVKVRILDLLELLETSGIHEVAGERRGDPARSETAVG